MKNSDFIINFLENALWHYQMANSYLPMNKELRDWYSMRIENIETDIRNVKQNRKHYNGS